MHKDHLNFCLVVDMIGSTEKLIKLPLGQFHDFGRAMVEQMKEHWGGLEMDGQQIKFTGDGWMVFGTTNTAIQKLCCLALVMSKKFQEDMATRTGIATTEIPALRLFIASAVDAQVTLPNGQIDFISDSARRANRYSSLCKPNEILTDPSVQHFGPRDFDFVQMTNEDRATREQPKHDEEKLDVWILNGLSNGVRSWGSMPSHYAYVFAQVRTKEETIVAVKEAVTELNKKDSLSAANQTTARDLIQAFISGAPTGATANAIIASEPRLYRLLDSKGYTILISKQGSFAEALGVLKTMKADGVNPDVFNYTAALNKAVNYKQGLDVLEMMKIDLVQPNEFTYSTLLNKADTYEQGQSVLEMMRSDNVVPNEVTYSTLMSKARSFEEGKSVLTLMKASNVVPNEVTYGTLISKAASFDQGQEVIDMMKVDDIPPNEIAWNTLLTKAPDVATAMKLVDDALRNKVPLRLYLLNTVFSRPIGSLSATELLKWFWSLPQRPVGCMEPVIANFLRARRLQDAIQVVLHYPFLTASLKLMREKPKECEVAFLQAYEQPALKPPASYALALYWHQAGKNEESLKYIKKAINLAKADKKKELLRDWMKTNLSKS
jgi:hypothetical protein